MFYIHIESTLYPYHIHVTLKEQNKPLYNEQQQDYAYLASSNYPYLHIFEIAVQMLVDYGPSYCSAQTHLVETVSLAPLSGLFPVIYASKYGTIWRYCFNLL